MFFNVHFSDVLVFQVSVIDSVIKISNLLKFHKVPRTLEKKVHSFFQDVNSIYVFWIYSLNPSFISFFFFWYVYV